MSFSCVLRNAKCVFFSFLYAIFRLKYLRLAPEIAFDRRGNYNKKSGGEVRRAADAGGPRVALRGAFWFLVFVFDSQCAYTFVH